MPSRATLTISQVPGHSPTQGNFPARSIPAQCHPQLPVSRPLRPQGPRCLPPQPLTAALGALPVPRPPIMVPSLKSGVRFSRHPRGESRLCRPYPVSPSRGAGQRRGREASTEDPSACRSDSDPDPEPGFRLATEGFGEWARKSRPSRSRPARLLAGRRGVLLGVWK